MTLSSKVKGILPHIVVVFLFILAAVAYFNPILQGKKIMQSDIVQYIGMSKQQTDFRNDTGEEPYWIDSAFGGMPTYQLGAQYPHNYVKKLDRLIRFLPRPADYLFLYFIGFYILLLVLKVDYRIAFLGSLAFGFSTYFIIILGVGHNAKAHAIGYMPLVLSGILLIFQKSYWKGFFLLTIAMALELVANHIQMTYYLLLLVLVLGIVHLIEAFKNKLLPAYFKAIGVMALSVFLALLLNATSLLATKEYADESTRSSNGLSITPEGTSVKEKGLSYAYITEYSYGLLESFNLFIPRFMGGSSGEKLTKDSATYKELLKLGADRSQALSFIERAPTYWGEQTFIGAPAYVGAVVLFLFVLALFIVKDTMKWWLLSGTILSLLLSWGDNFAIITKTFLAVVPMYNKFRAVSSIQVLLELCIPVLGMVGLQRFIFADLSLKIKMDALKKSSMIVGGLALVFLCFKGFLFSFSGGADAMLNDQMGAMFVRALKEDRASMFMVDTARSLLLVVLTTGLLWLLLKEKVKTNLVLLGIIILVLFDLVLINKNYVNNTNFVSNRAYAHPFKPTKADETILKDTAHFRVYDIASGAFNTGRTSYFHRSLGGYHAAKPRRIQDLNAFYFSKGHTGVLNMFNVKYIITPGEEGGTNALQNPSANGSAWFVNNLIPVANDNEAILQLDSLLTKKEAVIENAYLGEISAKRFTPDSTGRITLKEHQPNHLTYTTSRKTPGFAVFSEMYYAKGWKSFIDGKEAPHFRVNYALRGMEIPSGQHEITFTFDPQVVKIGSTITLASSIIFVLLFFGWLFMLFKRHNKAA